MNLSSRRTITVVLTGIWVNASEFFRNEILLKSYWVAHYRKLGLTFPSTPQNGIVWMAWGFLFALAIQLVSTKFDLLQTTFISWFMAFLLMWLVAWNLDVLPSAILIYAVPLSLLESFIGAYICIRMARQNG
jgi:hypothetical protein